MAVCCNTELVSDKPLGSPAYVKLVYSITMAPDRKSTGGFSELGGV